MLLSINSVVALAAAIGAQAATGPAPVASALAATPSPNLYVLRAHALPSLFGATIKIDGRKVTALGEKQYTAVALTPGRHSVKVSWSFFAKQPSREVEVDLTDGRPHYLELWGKVAGFNFAGAIAMARMDGGLKELSAEDGAKRMADCCRLKPAQ